MSQVSAPDGWGIGSRRFYEAHRIPLRLLFNLLLRVRAHNLGRLPRQGGVVIVCNHLTDFDPLILATLVPRRLHFMAKEELYRGMFKPLGWWLLRTGTFPVRRGAVDRAALKHAEQLLRDGRVVMIFPEGHRSVTAELQEARAGAVLLASRTGCPILPMAIAGTEALRWTQHRGWAKLRLFSRPAVQVWAGELITVDAARGRGRKEAADRVMRQIVSLLPPAYHGVYAES